jgi:hypothetical protein
MERAIFRHDCFDLILDSGLLTPPEVADAISARLRKGPGDALATLAQRLGPVVARQPRRFGA